MSRFLAGCLATLLFVATAGPIPAAVIQVTPRLGAVVRHDFATPVDGVIVGQSGNRVFLNPGLAEDGDYLLQVDFYMTIRDLGEGQVGFANTVFNLELSDSLIRDSLAPDWIGNTDLVERTCGAISCPGITYKWATTGDFGEDPSDLKYILLETLPLAFVNSHATDPRRRLGQSEDGDIAGQMYVHLADIAGTTGSIHVDVLGGSVYGPDYFATTAGTTGADFTLHFEVMPEPSSVWLACFGVLAVCTGRMGVKRFLSGG